MYLELSKDNEEIASGLINMPIDTYFHKLYEASPNKNYCQSFETYMKNFKEELENIYLSHQSKKVNKDFLTFK